MKLYHFCAMRQGAGRGVLSYTDGTIQSAANFADAEQYTALKREIADLMNTKGEGATDVVLLSLTLIGDETPNAALRGGEAVPLESTVMQQEEP